VNSVEIKCRRCKRIRIIPMDQLAERYKILLQRTPKPEAAEAESN